MKNLFYRVLWKFIGIATTIPMMLMYTWWSYILGSTNSTVKLCAIRTVYSKIWRQRYNKHYACKNLWTTTDFGEFFHREELNQDSAPLNLRFPPQNLPALVSGSMLQPRGHSGDNLAQRHRCRDGHLRCLRIPTRAHPRGVLCMTSCTLFCMGRMGA